MPGSWNHPVARVSTSLLTRLPPPLRSQFDTLTSNGITVHLDLYPGGFNFHLASNRMFDCVCFVTMAPWHGSEAELTWELDHDQFGKEC